MHTFSINATTQGPSNFPNSWSINATQIWLLWPSSSWFYRWRRGEEHSVRAGAQQGTQIKPQSREESSGLSNSLLTQRFPWASRKLCQGNIQLHVLLVIISTLKRLPWTPFLLGCTWGQPTAYGLLLFARHRWLLRAAQCMPRTLALPFLCTFPCNPRLSGSRCKTTALTSRAQLGDFTKYLAKHAAFDIVQNNREDVHAGMQEKPSVLKVFPRNQVKTKTETDWDVLPLFSFLSVLFSFVLYECFFVLGLMRSPRKCMKNVPIAFQRLRTRPPVRMNTCLSYCIYSH